MHREDFKLLDSNIVYLDNGATTLKPKCVIDVMDKYYLSHTSNIHRGDYDAAIKTNKLYDDVRDIVADFINCDANTVIYTSGATMSINMVVFGFMKNYLKKDDEVLLNKAEHASNILPWIKLQEEIGFTIKYVPLNDDYSLTLDNIKNSITDKTKVISLAHVSNVIGDVRDIKEITKYAHEKGIIVNVDGSQSVPHMKIDFEDLDIDFLSFSGHKMCGPTGIGILVGKYELLEKMNPIMYGGGMNSSFEDDNSYELKSIPTRFEAGTPPIAEVIGLGEAIKYLESIGMDKIHEYEMDLKKYFLDKVKDINNIIIYNKSTNSGIISLNIDGVFAQDTSMYLNHYKIAVRAGNHCTKLLKDEMNIRNTVRVSLYFYNNHEDIDKLIEALKNSKDIFNVII